MESIHRSRLYTALQRKAGAKIITLSFIIQILNQLFSEKSSVSINWIPETFQRAAPSFPKAGAKVLPLYLTAKQQYNFFRNFLDSYI